MRFFVAAHQNPFLLRPFQSHRLVKRCVPIFLTPTRAGSFCPDTARQPRASRTTRAHTTAKGFGIRTGRTLFLAACQFIYHPALLVAFQAGADCLIPAASVGGSGIHGYPSLGRRNAKLPHHENRFRLLWTTSKSLLRQFGTQRVHDLRPLRLTRLRRTPLPGCMGNNRKNKQNHRQKGLAPAASCPIHAHDNPLSFLWILAQEAPRVSLHDSVSRTHLRTTKNPQCQETAGFGMVSGLLGWLFGAGDRNRTGDLRVTSALLYLLSYAGLAADCIGLRPSLRCAHDSTRQHLPVLQGRRLNSPDRV